MTAYQTHWPTLLLCLCILGLEPNTSEARKGDEQEQYKKSERQFLPGERSPNYPQKGDRSKKRDQVNQDKSRKDRGRHEPPRRRSEQHPPERRDRSDRDKSRKHRDQHQSPPRRSEQRPPERRDRSDRDKSRKHRDQHQSPPRRSEQRPPERRDRSDRDKSRQDRDRHQPPSRRSEQHSPKRRDRSERDRVTRTKPKRRSRSSHDRHYERYSKRYSPHRHHHHETYRYHTHFIAPIRRHYHPIGFRLWYLPHAHLRIVVHGLPYFYFGGVFYRYHTSGYIVVRAPIGAVVNVLPTGFIAFSLGGFTYYYINDTYYLWDDDYEAYVVVNKPTGADAAIIDATQGRLFIYPNLGQSEEQQAEDRYECHRWAVHETHVDPTLDDENELSRKERDDYKRAISACLEGRGYTVK